MRKSTINVDPKIHRELKIEATRREITIGELVERILRERSRTYEDYCKNLKNELEDYEGEHKEILQKLPNFLDMLIRILEADITGILKLSKEERLEVNAVLGYILLPYDMIPEEVYGPVGYIDDIFLSTFILEKLLKSRNLELVKERWDFNEDISKLVDEINSESRCVIEGENRKPEDILHYLGLER